jgi:hypothetical protein
LVRVERLAGVSVSSTAKTEFKVGASRLPSLGRVVVAKARHRSGLFLLVIRKTIQPAFPR